MTVFQTVLSVLVLLLATAARGTLGHSEEDLTTDAMSCDEVLSPRYDNGEPLTVFLPDNVTCQDTKVVRFAGTARVTIFVDDAHFDKLHFEVEPQASLRILSRGTMLFNRAKGSDTPIFAVQGTLSFIALAGATMKVESGSPADASELISKGEHGVVIFPMGSSATALSKDSLHIHRPSPPPTAVKSSTLLHTAEAGVKDPEDNPAASSENVPGGESADGFDSNTVPGKSSQGVGSSSSVSREEKKLPPFLGGLPADAMLKSLKVGETLTFPQRLVSPSGAASISVSADASVVVSRAAAEPSSPGTSTVNAGTRGAGPGDAGDAVDSFLLLSSSYRQVFRAIEYRERLRWHVKPHDIAMGAETPDSARQEDGGKRKWWQRWKGSMFNGKEKKQRWREKVQGPDATAGEEVTMSITNKAVIEVKIDGDSVLRKAGPSKHRIVNKIRCFMRRRCEGYEASASDDGGLEVKDETGGLVYKLTSPDL